MRRIWSHFLLPLIDTHAFETPSDDDGETRRAERTIWSRPAAVSASATAEWLDDAPNGTD